jgi:S-formylglutathione hydrolase
MALEVLSEHACFGGTQGFYRHESRECASPMRFSVFRPPQAGPRPVLCYLAGLTCTEETFMIKAGAQRLAAELGILLVAPDVSPRVPRYPGDDESWDFGLGAGFYVDATQAPWSASYRMFSYVTKELPEVLAARFPADAARQSIFGHSMGGHGALVCGLRNPSQYRSVSAFAPIVAPMQVPWGEKAFSRYLGSDRSAWARYDACELAKSSGFSGEILIDQGLADKFLEVQLQPRRFVEACRGTHIVPRLREHAAYDHSYWFIQGFVADHLRFHAERLGSGES